MYVGITSVGVEYEVKFLRKSYWGGFTFPNVADICDIAKSDVVLNSQVHKLLKKLQGQGDNYHFQ